MHDIICPNCGERFMGYEVVFDLSNEIIPLLCKDPNDESERTEMAALKFHYYVDEETIKKAAAKKDDLRLLECRSAAGPDAGARLFPFKVTRNMLYKYICSYIPDTYGDEEEKEQVFFSLFRNADSNARGKNMNQTQREIFAALYNRLFGVAHKTQGNNSQSADGGADGSKMDTSWDIRWDTKQDVDFNDAHVKSALSIMDRLYKSRHKALREDSDDSGELDDTGLPFGYFDDDSDDDLSDGYDDDLNDESANEEITLPVCICYTDKNDAHHIPYRLFVNGPDRVLGKRCRFCGKMLPKEFGHYKMKPVVLLGAHSSGKTSYLLSLLYSITRKEPFISQAFKVHTLEDDNSLRDLNEMLQNYEQQKASRKTDEKTVPVLNLLYKDTIYSLIDWPGEKFIKKVTNIQEEAAGTAYALNSRRVIKRARHVLFFIPPKQVDGLIQEAEDSVFGVTELMNRLRIHLELPDQRRECTFTCIINKADKLAGCSGTDGIADYIKVGALSTNFEIRLLNDKTWNCEEFDKLTNSAKAYIQIKNPQLFSDLEDAKVGSKKTDTCYLLVAPMGCEGTPADSDKKQGHEAADKSKAEVGRKVEELETVGVSGAAKADVQKTSNVVVNQGLLAGVPFLAILHHDGLI